MICNKGNPLPPSPVKKLHTALHSLLLVDHDAGDIRKLHISIDQHDRNPRKIALDSPLDRFSAKHGADESYPLHTALLNEPDTLQLFLFLRTGPHDDRAIAPLCQLLLDLNMMTDTDVLDQDADHPRGLLYQPARGGIRAVMILFQQSQDPPARLLLHSRLPIYDAGDRTRRDAGLSRDIINRHHPHPCVGNSQRKTRTLRSFSSL